MTAANAMLGLGLILSSIGCGMAGYRYGMEAGVEKRILQVRKMLIFRYMCETIIHDHPELDHPFARIDGGAGGTLVVRPGRDDIADFTVDGDRFPMATFTLEPNGRVLVTSP